MVNLGLIKIIIFYSDDSFGIVVCEVYFFIDFISEYGYK